MGVRAGRLRAVVGAFLVPLCLLSTAISSGRAEAILLTAAAPLLSPSLFWQIENANTGGKGVCGASMTSDGNTAFYIVRLPQSTSGPSRTGVYERNLVTGGEQLLWTPPPNVFLDCGVASGDGALYAFSTAPVNSVGTPSSDDALHRLDVATGTVTKTFDGFAGLPKISDDHRYVFGVPGDTNDPGIYRYDTTTS